MNRTTLQVPMSTQLREQAEKQAFEQGFSSLQEAVRLFLSKLAKGAFDITFEKSVQLSPKAIKKYDKMIDEIEKGKVKTKTFTDVDTLMKHLHSEN